MQLMAKYKFIRCEGCIEADLYCQHNVHRHSHVVMREDEVL